MQQKVGDEEHIEKKECNFDYFPCAIVLLIIVIFGWINWENYKTGGFD